MRSWDWKASPYNWIIHQTPDARLGIPDNQSKTWKVNWLTIYIYSFSKEIEITSMTTSSMAFASYFLIVIQNWGIVIYIYNVIHVIYTTVYMFGIYIYMYINCRLLQYICYIYISLYINNETTWFSFQKLVGHWRYQACSASHGCPLQASWSGKTQRLPTEL